MSALTVCLKMAYILYAVFVRIQPWLLLNFGTRLAQFVMN